MDLKELSEKIYNSDEHGILDLADEFVEKVILKSSYIDSTFISKVLQNVEYDKLQDMYKKIRSDRPIVRRGYMVSSSYEVIEEIEDMIYQEFVRENEQHVINLLSQLKVTYSKLCGSDDSKFMEFASTVYRIMKYTISERIHELENRKSNLISTYIEELEEIVMRKMLDDFKQIISKLYSKEDDNES